MCKFQGNKIFQLISAIDTYLPVLTKVINYSIKQNKFPNELKLADLLLIYKKKTHLNKLSGFCKNYNTQYCLTSMLEKWKNTLNKGKSVGAVFTDLSEDFDTVNHKFLIAKLETYRFSNNPETLKYCFGVQCCKSYLTGRSCLFSLGWPSFQ